MAGMIVDCGTYRDGKRTEGPEDFSDALAEVRAAGDGFLWIGLADPTAAEFDHVAEEFGLHPLAVEDAVTAHQRPKVDIYQDSVFTVLKTAAYHQQDETVSIGELMIFLGDSYVMTVRHGPESPLKQLRAKLEEQPELLAHGPAAVLYAICDLVVDQYLDVATELQTDLDELEEEIFSPGRSRGAAERIYGFKRQVVGFRKATFPLMEPALRLTRAGADVQVPFVADGLRPYFRDVADHLAKVNEVVESLDRLLSDILSANLAQVSVQQNDDMRKISAWAALAAVPTMIAGIYGMNFEHMPELRQPWGYPVALGLMAGVCVGLHRLFKRAGWL
ncbi:magnesium transporter [Kitasatospora cineracea]|uniref:Magnesium transport protein CorA n=2 Tax=Kitasatospora cineracea TaxID=88074 RepID=A0A3N4RES1_9ACTN|nr:magnesium/cobalt transporter CorA [Kitasatospora cineracea]ROR37324.1 magnesium transporter [Kitasatospora cineracea]RPE29221.1 magnesium transporter [Kitasatospora cineracea]